MGISDGIPAVPLNRKLSEFCSEPFRRRIGILFRGTKIEGTLGILSEPFCGRLSLTLAQLECSVGQLNAA
jgi:hypothetical protein